MVLTKQPTTANEDQKPRIKPSKHALPTDQIKILATNDPLQIKIGNQGSSQANTLSRPTKSRLATNDQWSRPTNRPLQISSSPSDRPGQYVPLRRSSLGTLQEDKNQSRQPACTLRHRYMPLPSSPFHFWCPARPQK